MMGWGYGGGAGYGAAFGVVGFVFWLVLFVDAVLLGVWLWKQVQKK